MLARLHHRSLNVLLRCFSSNSKAPDINAIFGDSLSKEQLKELKIRVSKMNQESYKQAMSSQLPEMGYQADRLLKNLPKPEERIPSRSALLRQNTKAIQSLRFDVYSRAISEGLDEKEANRVTTEAIERASTLFKQKTDETMDKFKQKADIKQAEEDQANEKVQKLYDYASERLQEIFASKLKKQTFDYTPVEPDPNAPKIFGKTEKALNFFDTKQLKPIPTSYWAEMERRKAEIVNMAMGPTNAFEEQIEWTEKGQMWPYPIDNEYLMGVEENVHFTEHIFVDRYLAKYPHLPKTGPIAHFMELVCVGLSKNPYMTLEKKHMHLDSFAEFFNPEQIEKVHRMHEEAEKQAV